MMEGAALGVTLFGSLIIGATTFLVMEFSSSKVKGWYRKKREEATLSCPDVEEKHEPEIWGDDYEYKIYRGVTHWSRFAHDTINRYTEEVFMTGRWRVEEEKGEEIRVTIEVYWVDRDKVLQTRWLDDLEIRPVTKMTVNKCGGE